MYSSSLNNGSQWFLFKLSGLFDCGGSVHLNFYLLKILKFFKFSIGGFGVGFRFSFPFVLAVDLCLFFVACV